MYRDCLACLLSSPYSNSKQEEPTAQDYEQERRGAAMPDHATIPFPGVADKYSPLKRSLAAISMYCTVIDRYVFKARERERDHVRSFLELPPPVGCMHACYPLQSPHPGSDRQLLVAGFEPGDRGEKMLSDSKEKKNPLQSPAMIQTREGSFLPVLLLPCCCASSLNPAVDY
jgi:hypothetical protein